MAMAEKNEETTLTKGDAVWKKTAAWIEANPVAYEFIRANALNYAQRNVTIPIKLLVEMTRFTFHVHIPNAIAPALARYLMATDARLRGKFDTKPSCTDGYFPDGGDE